MGEMTLRHLLVFGERNFKISIPDDAKISYGPWSPPPRDKSWPKENKLGTLRVYQGSKDHLVALFTGVTWFYEEGMDFAELEKDVVKAPEKKKKPGRDFSKLKILLEEQLRTLAKSDMDEDADELADEINSIRSQGSTAYVISGNSAGDDGD